MHGGGMGEEECPAAGGLLLLLEGGVGDHAVADALTICFLVQDGRCVVRLVSGVGEGARGKAEGGMDCCCGLSTYSGCRMGAGGVRKRSAAGDWWDWPACCGDRDLGGFQGLIYVYEKRPLRSTVSLWRKIVLHLIALSAGGYSTVLHLYCTVPVSRTVDLIHLLKIPSPVQTKPPWTVDDLVHRLKIHLKRPFSTKTKAP